MARPFWLKHQGMSSPCIFSFLVMQMSGSFHPGPFLALTCSFHPGPFLGRNKNCGDKNTGPGGLVPGGLGGFVLLRYYDGKSLPLDPLLLKLHVPTQFGIQNGKDFKSPAPDS